MKSLEEAIEEYMKQCKTSFNKGDLIVYDGPRRPVGEDNRCFGRIRWIYGTINCVFFTVIWLTSEGWVQEFNVIRSFCHKPNEEELSLFIASRLHDFPSPHEVWKSG